MFLIVSKVGVWGQATANFSTNPTHTGNQLNVCAGSSVLFVFISQGQNITASTVVTWNFITNSGTSIPSQNSTNLRTPFPITFPNGTYTVTLTVTDPATGSSSVKSLNINATSSPPVTPTLSLYNNPLGWSSTTIEGVPAFVICPSNLNDVQDVTFSINPALNCSQVNSIGFTEATSPPIDCSSGLIDASFSPNSSRFYYSIFTVQFSGCLFSRVYYVQVGTPSISITSASSTACDPGNYSLGFTNQTPGVNYQIDWNSPSGFTSDYSSSYPNLPLSPNQVSNTYSFSPCTNNSAPPNIIQVRATNTCGFSSTNPSQVFVSKAPDAIFIRDPDVNVICKGTTVNYTNQSTSGTFVNSSGVCTNNYHLWWQHLGTGVNNTFSTTNLGTSSTSSPGPQSFSVTYNDVGTYTIRLIVKNNSCANDTMVKTVCVIPNVLANFTPQAATTCVGQSLSMTNGTSGVGCSTSTMQYQWSVASANPENCGTPSSSFSNSTNSTSTSPTILFSGPGNYTVQLQAQLSPAVVGCSTSTVTQLINVKGPPTIGAVSGESVICQNQALNLSAAINQCYGSPITYSWTFPPSLNSSITSPSGGSINSSGTVTTNPSFSNHGSGSIGLSATNSCGTTNTSHNITVNQAAITNVDTILAVCNTQTVNLYGSITGGTTQGAVPVAWTLSPSNAGSLSNNNYPPSQNTLTLNSSFSGNVTVTLTSNDPDGTGPCPATNDSQTFNVSSGATVNAGADQAVCAGQNISLAGTIGLPATSGTWTTLTASPNKGTFSNASSLSTTYTPSSWEIANGSVTLVLTTNDPDGPCEAAQDQVTVTIKPLPNVVASVPNKACSGTPYNVSLVPSVTTSPATYTWSVVSPSPLPANFTTNTTGSVTTGNSFTTTATNNTNNPVTLTYLVVATVNGCSGPADTANITINPVTNVSIPPVTICSGVSASLSATGTPSGGTYVWSTGATTQAISVSPTSTQTYSVTYTLNGCTSTTSVQVTVNPKPTVSVVSNPNTSTICAGNSYQLTATGNPVGGTYIWSPNNQTSAQITVTTLPTQFGPLTNSVIYTFNGCSSDPGLNEMNIIALPTVSLPDPFICAGQSTTLTSTVSPSGGTYSWSTGASSNQITVNPSTTTTYTLNYTAGGCTNSDVGTVTVTNTPTVSVQPSSLTMCSGESRTIVATGNPVGGIYTWSNGASTASITVSPGTNTTYTVTYSLNGCASQSASSTVTVNPGPTVTINSPTICSLQSTTLTASGTPGGGSYVWSTGATTAAVSLSNLTNTTTAAINQIYTVTYSLSGCNIVQQGTVTINPIPTVTVSNSTICAGASATVTATAVPSGGTYVWSANASGATGPSFTATPTTTQTYTVTYSLNGCTAPASSGIITVNPIPTVTIASNPASGSVCAGQQFQLTATGSPGGGTYAWSPGGQTGSQITLLTTTGQVGVQTNSVVYILNGCSSVTASKDITVLALPTVNVSSASICSGQSTTLTSSVNPSGGTYLWSTGATTATISVGPTTTTSYTLNYTAGGCTNSDSGTVTVTNTPAVSVNNTAFTICSGESVTIVATGNPSNGTYAWSNGETSPSITVAPGATTNYTVTYSLNGCASQIASSSVTVNPGPTVTINSPTICSGQSTTLTASGTPGGGSYVWSTGATTATVSLSNLTNTTTAAINQNYSVTYSLSGCNIVQQGTVTINPIPIVTVNNSTICAGASATVTATAVPSGGTYVWSANASGATVPSFTVTPATTQTYTVTYSLNGCTSPVSSGSVTVNTIPTVSIASNPATGSVCAGQQFQLTATGSPGGGTYVWSPGGQTTNQITVTTTSGQVGTLTNSVIYTLNGCSSASESKNITVLALPNVDVPNASICSGQSTTVTSTVSPSGGTYSWSTGATTDQIPVNPTTTTTYTLNYTAGGCTNSDAGIVSVTNTPSVSLNNTSFTICSGESAIIVATGSPSGGTYAWSNGATTPSITVTPGSNETYTVTYSLNGCPSTPQIANVIVNPGPTLSMNLPTVSLCSGQSTSLTATGTPSGGTYVWSGGLGTTASISLNNLTNTTSSPIVQNYSVTYSLNNCQITASSVVTINPIPVLTVNSSTLCLGQSITITANSTVSGGTYTWSANAGSVNTQAITVTPTATDNYSVTYSAGGCSANATSNIVVNAYPDVTISPVTICSGQSAVITATPSTNGGTYAWSPGGNTTQTLTVNPIQNTVYTVSYTLNGCTDTDTALVTVKTTPTLTVINPSICVGQSATITSTASISGGTYAWSNGESTSSITVSPTSTSNYTLSYTANGCPAVPAISTVTVNVTPTLSANSPTICAGQNTAINAIASPTGGTYTWSNSATTSSITVNPTVNTSYTVSYSLNGCASAPFTSDVTVNELPTISGNDESLCAGSSVNLSTTVSAPGGTYLWSPSTGLSSTTIDSPVASPSSSQTYTVVYTLNGCSSLPESVQVNVIQNPVATVNNTSICSGSSATLTAGPVGASYAWSTGETTSSISVSPTSNTQYSVTVVLAGCPTSSATSNVTVYEIPSLTVNSSTICVGQSASLTASSTVSGGVYTWSTGQTGEAITVSPTSTTNPTTYTVSYTANGCAATPATSTVTVNPVPTVSIPATSSVCSGSSVTIPSTVNLTGGTYAWSTGATTPDITVSPTSNQNYTVTYSLNGCSITSAAGNVVVNAIPTVTATNATICNGQTASVQATGSPNAGGTYLWSTGSTSNTLSDSPTSNTSYTVTYTVNNCPSQAATANVTVNPIPTITISDVTICGGLSTTLIPVVSPTGGTYAWSTGGSGTEITVNPSITTTYSLSYTANGCTASKSINVTVIDNPSASVASSTICFGQSTTLQALPNGATYSWSNGETTQSILVSPTTTSNYTVTVSIGGCAPTTATATVTVNPIPTVSIAQDQTICNGGTTTLTATGTPSGGTYLWSNGLTGNTTSVSPSLSNPTLSQQFPYNVIYTLNGCPSLADTGLVIVNPIPTVSIPATTSVCSGSSVNVASTVNLLGGSYLWSTGETTSSIDVNPTTTTGYTVSYTLNGCSSSSANGNVVVNAIPTVTTTNATICNGQTASVQATGSPSAGGTYLWSTGSTSNSISINLTTDTQYTVTYTVNNCPSQPATANVTVNPIPTITISDVTICGGLSTTLNPVVSPTGGTYAWSTGGSGTEITVNPSSTDTYTLSYTANGCTATKNITVTVIQNPIAAIGDQSICFGDTIVLVASPSGATYSWTGANIIGATNQQQIQINPSSTTTYTVTTQIGGCASSSATATVTVKPIPTVAIAQDQTICNGSSTTLSATGTPSGGTYLWSNGNTVETNTISPSLSNPTLSQQFPYNVIYTLNGCPSLADTGLVIVNPVPTVSIPATSSVCSGSSVNVASTVNLPGGSYLWSTGETTSSIDVNPTTTTGYTVSYTLNGCSSSSANGNVVVNAIPTVTTTNATICNGQTASVQATGSPSAGGTYLWSTGSTSNSISINPTTDTQYTVTYTVNNCPSQPATASVIVNPIPTITISDVTICGGLSTTLIPVVSPTGGTYAWSTGGSGTEITVNPSSTDTYTLSYTANGCTATKNITVTVIQNPIAAISDQSICFGDTIVLVASPSGATYSWTGANIIGPSDQQQIQINPSSTTTYTVTTQIGGCASSTATATVTVKPIPTVAIAQDQTICNGSSTTLSASGTPSGGTYLWSNGTSGATNTISPSLSNPTLSQQFPYNVIYTLNGCPSLADTGLVIVNPVPTVSIPATTSVCSGSSVNVASTVNLLGGSYLWSTGETTSSIDVNPTTTTGYTVSYTLNGCSSSSANGNVVVNAIPTVSVTSATICNGQTASVQATGTPAAGGTYLWSTGSTSNSISINPTTDTQYTVTYTVNNCPSQPATANVTVNPIPTITLADTTICGGLSVTLTPLVSPTGGTYAWSNGSNSQSISVSPSSTTSYTVTYTVNGCTASKVIAVNVIQNPSAAVSSVTICEGQSTTLVANPPNGIYTWTDGTNTLGTSQTLTVSPVVTSTYTVSVSVGGCAPSSATATVTVNPIPSVDVSPEIQSICNGQIATISSEVNPGGGTYQWQGSTVNSQATPSINVSPVLIDPLVKDTFSYVLTYTVNGCNGVNDTVLVIVKPKPVVSVNNLVLCSGSNDTIEANPNLPGGIFNWENGVSGPTDSIIIVGPLSNPLDQVTTYFYDSWYILDGCSSDTVTSTVTVNPIPTVTVNSPTICNYQSATLTVTPSSTGGTFLWSGPTIPSSGITTQTISVSPNLSDPVTQESFVYSVTYTDLGCTSIVVNSNVTVNPTPVIQPINEIICSGGSFDTIPNPSAAGNIIPAGTTYTWTYADNPDILNEANNSISSTNISGGPLTSTVNVTTDVDYTVIPTSGASGACVGTPFNFNITITATPTIANKIDSICSGSFPVLDFISTDVVPPGTQYSWVILFDNPLISGQTNQPTFVSDFSNQILLNNDVNAQPQTLTYLVTPRSGPCPGATFQLQVTVLPAPILSNDTLTICSDDNITSYTFGTPGDIIPIGTEYTWVVLPNTTITGQTSNAVPSSTFNTGILHNTSNINDTLHYVITPIASANNPPCVGEPFDFLVIVQPTPVLQNVTLAPICSGTSFSYTPVDASPVTIWPAQNGGFTWTVAPNINVTGQTSNPNDPESTLSQTLTNLTNVVENVVYTITPYDTISGCTGANFTVIVPVNPRPKVLDTLISVCSGQPFSVVPPNNQPNNIVPIGTSYSWPTPVDNPLGSISGESAANNQPSISQTLTNINSIICDTMFYMITPSVGTAPGLVCVGDPFELAVRVKPLPTLTATAGSNLICPGDCTPLTATPSITVDCNGVPGSYSWTPPLTLSPTPPTTNIVSACPTQNTTYNVTYTLDGCSVSASTTINIVNPPNISTISVLEQTICEGGCTILTANIQNQSVVPEYVEWSNGDVDYTSPFSILVCPTDTTTYTATAYLAGCSGNTASVTVNVNTDPLILVQPTPDTTICVGGTYPLSVTLQFGAGTALYQWYFTTNGTNSGGTPIAGASGSIVTNTSGYTVLYTPPAFATAGNYTYYCVITYGPNGCGSLTTAPATIHVINDPVVSISPFTSDSLCVGGTAQCLQAIVSGGIGTNSYLWNPGGAIDQTFCPPSDSAGTFNYSVIVTQTGIGCGSLPSNIVPIYIVPDPIVTILGEIEVCDGAEVPLTSTVTGGIGTVNNYTWNQSQPVGSPNTLMTWTSAGDTTVPLFEDITYQLNITQTGNGCNAVDTHFINVVPDPIVVVDYDSLVCLNTPTEFVANVIGGTGTAYFDWYQVDSLLTVGGTQIPTDSPTDNSIIQTLYEAYWNFYYVSLQMSGLGCDPDTSDLIIVEGLEWAVADFDIQPDSLVQSLFDPTFSFINQSENATNYWWDLGECDPQLPNSGLYQTPSQYYNPTATNVIDYTYGCEPGIYSVQLVATNQGLCPDTIIKQIKIKDEIVIYVPNTFTPNGDGINDLFIPIITTYSGLDQYEFRIYDRWGEVIFESKTVGEGWDGIAGRPWPGVTGTNYPTIIPYGDPNKQRPQDGTYTWTLRARLKASSEVEDYRGHVNIIR